MEHNWRSHTELKCRNHTAGGEKNLPFPTVQLFFVFSLVKTLKFSQLSLITVQFQLTRANFIFSKSVFKVPLTVNYISCFDCNMGRVGHGVMSVLSAQWCDIKWDDLKGQSLIWNSLFLASNHSLPYLQHGSIKYTLTSLWSVSDFCTVINKLIKNATDVNHLVSFTSQCRTESGLYLILYYIFE